MKLSVIIPSYKDPLLQKTINSLLENSELGDQMEIIPVFDGYWPNPPLLFSEEDNKKVIQLHLGKNRGMRDAINAGVRVSRGEYIMRTDEHCVFSKGFDRVMLERFKPDWIVYLRRFCLDPEKWVRGEDPIMDIPPNVYNKLVIDPNWGKFSAVNWKSREKGREHKLIDESMGMQGSMWCMKRTWWDKIGELETEGYGPQVQDSHEMVFKTWKHGGRLMVNKNAWYGHKHRDFNRTHQYPRAKAKEEYKYCLSIWEDYYQKEIRPRWNI